MKHSSSKRTAKPRVVLVVELFPTPMQAYVADRFLRLRDLGWDAHVVCRDVDDEEWQTFPAFTTRPKLRRRIHEDRGKGLAATIAALSPHLIHVEFAHLAPPLLPLRGRLPCACVVSFQTCDPQLVSRAKAYRALWAEADAVHTVSTSLWRFMQEAGCPADKPHAVIPPGVDAAFFDPGARLHRDVAGPSRPLRVLSVGRLHWSKGYDYGLQAVRLLRDQGLPCDYHIIGGGSFRPAVEYAIADLGLRDSVRMIGARGPREVQQDLRWADVLLQPSLSEAFGVAAIEAQAMMVPVVCSDANGLPEAVAAGESGLIVPRRDAAALATALCRLAADPGERQRLGENGRRRVLAHFQPETQARRFDALYRQVLGLPAP